MFAAIKLSPVCVSIIIIAIMIFKTIDNLITNKIAIQNFNHWTPSPGMATRRRKRRRRRRRRKTTRRRERRRTIKMPKKRRNRSKLIPSSYRSMFVQTYGSFPPKF